MKVTVYKDNKKLVFNKVTKCGHIWEGSIHYLMIENEDIVYYISFKKISGYSVTEDKDF